MVKKILLILGLVFGVPVALTLAWVGIYALNNVELQVATDAELASWRTRETVRTTTTSIKST